MKHHILLIGGLLFLAMFTGCGPNAEQIATMTASAWTPTPPPTATPTPVPYSVNVSVVDESGAPVAGAYIVFSESGNGEPVQANEEGQYSWNNLEGENATFEVSAQGYFPAEQTITLQRGMNEIGITLKRDPFSLLPSEGCATGEKMLYAEDFQDGHAQGWNEIDLKTPGWDMAPSADEAGNIILSGQYTDMLGDQPLNSRLGNMEFDNAVWRVRFLISTPFTTQENWFSFNWRHALEPYDLNGQQVFDSRYQLPIGINSYALRRLQQPVSNIGIGQVNGPKGSEWHTTEISTYQGATEVWLDGVRLMAYRDPQPIPAGTIGLELWLKGSDTILYFDNIFVCELSAPFTSIAPATP